MARGLLKVEMRDLKEGPVELRVDCRPAAFDLSDEEFTFPEQVTGLVRYSLAGPRVLSRGMLHTAASTKCVRCLNDALVRLDAEVDSVYENDAELLKPETGTVALEERIVQYFDGDIIRPESEFREAILVELPSRPLCSPDCKGLCPHCGADLNEGPCACPKDVGDLNEWKAALKEIRLEK